MAAQSRRGMEVIPAGKFKSLGKFTLPVFFISALVHANQTVTCYTSLKYEDFSAGGGGLAKLFREEPLPLIVDAYGRNFPREAHEAEKAGYLYPVGKKFDARVDEDGKPRADGRYLFVVARDRQGNRRIMVVPRFEFQKADGKYLNTHRTMFRKYPDTFGPTPYVEVMGEMELLNGIVYSYNNKAGTAYDVREATQPELFRRRVAIAESMGIDLGEAEHVVNYAVIEAAKNPADKFMPGRHIEEEDYINITKHYYENPVTKRLIEHYDTLVQKMYTLFPEHGKRRPTVPYPLDDVQKAPFNMPKADAAGLSVILHSSQIDRPATVLSRGLAREKDGALGFSRMLDRMNYIVQTEEARQQGKAMPSWEAFEKTYEKQHTEDIAQRRYDKLHEDTRRILNFGAVGEEAKGFTWKVEMRYQHYIDNDYTKEQVLRAQLLMGELRKRFGITQELGGPFDFKKFSEIKFSDEDPFEEHVAQKMIYELLEESEKKDGNPMRLFDEMYKRAEAANEDEIHLYPYPGLIVSAYLRALGAIPGN